MSILGGWWAEVREWGMRKEKVEGQVSAKARIKGHLRSVMET